MTNDLSDRAVEALLDACGLHLPPELRTNPTRVKPCGTKAAYLRHLRLREEPCSADRDAYNQHRLAAREKRLAEVAAGTRTVQHRKAVQHGTRAGYDAHLYIGEPACDSCLEAQRIDSAEARHRRINGTQEAHAA